MSSGDVLGRGCGVYPIGSIVNWLIVESRRPKEEPVELNKLFGLTVNLKGKANEKGNMVMNSADKQYDLSVDHNCSRYTNDRAKSS